MLKTDAEVARERRAKKRKEQDTVDALILAKENKRLRDRVDFLEAALEAKSQSYEEDMTALEERLAEMREAAEAYIRRVTSGAPVECYATEKAENRLKEALSAAPAGQVLLRKRGFVQHDMQSWWGCDTRAEQYDFSSISDNPPDSDVDDTFSLCLSETLPVDEGAEVELIVRAVTEQGGE